MKAKDRSAIDYLNDIRDASEKAAVLLRAYSCTSWTNDLNLFFQPRNYNQNKFYSQGYKG
jgi:hypothetical protein